MICVFSVVVCCLLLFVLSLLFRCLLYARVTRVLIGFDAFFGHNFCRFGLFFMAKIKIFKIQEPFSPVFFQKNYVKMQILLFLLLVCCTFADLKENTENPFWGLDAPVEHLCQAA